jgi:flagellar assembly protein FliH
LIHPMAKVPLVLPHPLRQVRLAEPKPLNSVAEDRERAAFERGRGEAEKNLREQIVQQRAELAQMSQGILRSLKASATDVAKQSESLLVELAFELATRLVSGFPIDAARVAANVKEALAQVEDATDIRVQLHPEDMALFNQLSAEARPDASSGQPVQLIANPAIQRGGCLVQTRFGLIDNQPSTKEKVLRESIAA